MIAARASLLALLVCCAFAALADVAVPPLSGRVVDQTGTLSAGDISSLTQTLKDLETRKGSQVAVLIVPTTAPETIEQFSIRVAEAWKIGRKKIDDGALFVVAKSDRKLRIEVGYGLEGALTDVTASRIIEEIIVPKFRSGDFAGGISAGVARIVAVIDGEKLPAPQTPQWTHAPQSPQQGSDPLDHINPFTLFVLIAVAATLRSLAGRLIGSVMSGGMVGVLAWFIKGSLAPAFFMGVLAFIFTMFAENLAWYGGGGSYSGNSSSSDSGGFSGGGGSFGGGGASGSW